MAVDAAVSEPKAEEDWSEEPDQEDEGADKDESPGSALDLELVYLRQVGRTRLLAAEQEVELSRCMEAGLYAEYRLAKETVLSEELREDLRQIAKYGRQAKDHMLRANLRLVVSIARRYTSQGMDFLDLIQEGNLGLIRAVEKFDYTKGYKFSTYATWWVRQAIRRGIAGKVRTIRIPTHRLEEITKLVRVREDLSKRGYTPTIEDLSRELKISPARIAELLQDYREATSLDIEIGDDGTCTLGDLIEDTGAVNPFEAACFGLMLEELEAALKALDDRWWNIVRRRHGLYDGREWKYREIGEEYGLTSERVSQISRAALKRLRRSLYNY